jgi:hypothetical protein
MARITYGDKSTAQVSPLPEDQKWVSADANEVKESVNALYDINGVLVGVAGAVVDIGEGVAGQPLLSAGPGVAPAYGALNADDIDIPAPFLFVTIEGVLNQEPFRYVSATSYERISNPTDLLFATAGFWRVFLDGTTNYISDQATSTDPPQVTTSWTDGGTTYAGGVSQEYSGTVDDVLIQLGQAVTGSAMVVDYQPGPLGIMSGIAIFQGETLGGGVTFDLLTLIPGITGARFISASSPEGTPVFCGLGDGSLDTFIVSVLDISGSPIGDSNLIDVVIAYKL